LVKVEVAPHEADEFAKPEAGECKAREGALAVRVERRQFEHALHLGVAQRARDGIGVESLALYWAAESTSFSDRFWAGFDLVGKWEADVGLGGAALLGAGVRQAVGDEVGDALVDLLTVESRDQLARALESVHRMLGLGNATRRRTLLDALADGLRG
jgi:hypothetical protein